MKKLFATASLVMAMGVTPVFAHHPAADIVDEEIYAMIDSMVADTPHAEMTFDEMGAGLTETSITFYSVDDLENMIGRENLMEYIERLDGVVEVTIGMNDDGTATLTISQIE